MDTPTLTAPAQTAPAADPSAEAPHSPPPGTQSDSRRDGGLGAEVRESLLLLGFAVGVTVGLTTAAQAALALLG
jgi:hypothetical protein